MTVDRRGMGDKAPIWKLTRNRLGKYAAHIMEMTQDFALRLNTETWAYTTRLSKKSKGAKRNGKSGIHQ